MSVSVRTRFEVFKRDRFTCAYCGKHPPDALLEVDHIIPRAAGGSDDMDNLVTACWDCNSGKSDRLLEEGRTPVVRPSIEESKERAAQAAAYAEAVKATSDLQRQFEAMVVEAWARAYGARLVETDTGTVWQLDEYGRFPNGASIRRILRRLPVEDVLEAVDITAARMRWPNSGAESYFFGVCWRKLDEREGRTRE